MKTNKSLQQRLEENTFYSPDGCWYWTGCVGDRGYGILWVNGGNKRAHRVSYDVHKGPIGRFLVCHSCDNPLCINPDHLFLGSSSDNTLDMIKKGRNRILLGENNKISRLTNNQVLIIREKYKEGYQQKILANIFGVNKSHICSIVHNKSWTHI